MEGDVINRDLPDVPEQRRALVSKWEEEIDRAEKRWRRDFERMKKDAQFAVDGCDPEWRAADLPVVNVTQRHINQKVASLYARNPRAVAQQRQRIYHTIWDGSSDTLAQATERMRIAMQSGQEPDPLDIAIIQDAQNVRQESRRLARVGKTMEALWQYSLDEQSNPPFIRSAKRWVATTATCGVGYLKLGFERVMKPRPETSDRIADMTDRIARLRRQAADIADSRAGVNLEAEIEELRLGLAALAAEPQIVVREGLTFDFPQPWMIIPDADCVSLHGFIGARFVAHKFYLTPERIREIYEVDISQAQFEGYRRTGKVFDADEYTSVSSGVEKRHDNKAMACVYEVWDKATGMVLTLCRGYPDFLREPSVPDVKIERFWPFFPLTFNIVESEDSIFPVSDVSLIRPMQRQINSMRRALSEHRKAARPRLAARSQAINDIDEQSIKEWDEFGIIRLNLPDGGDVNQVLGFLRYPGVDPNLYNTADQLEDILRTVGSQELDFGGSSSSTATEASLADQARGLAASSNRHDLDLVLTELAQASSQLMLREFSLETVRKIVGPGAAWPQQSATEIAEEIYLRIEAGSSGKPNQARDIANLERLAPLLVQVPGLRPQWFAERLVRTIDETIPLHEAVDVSIPSIMAANRAAIAGPGIPGATESMMPPGVGGVTSMEAAEGIQPQFPSGPNGSDLA